MLIFEVASSSSFQDVPKNNFVTAPEEAATLVIALGENAFAFHLNTKMHKIEQILLNST